MAGDPAADRQALAEVIHLGLLWHCLCAITRLEVPDRLAALPGGQEAGGLAVAEWGA